MWRGGREESQVEFRTLIHSAQQDEHRVCTHPSVTVAIAIVVTVAVVVLGGVQAMERRGREGQEVASAVFHVLRATPQTNRR